MNDTLLPFHELAASHEPGGAILLASPAGESPRDGSRVRSPHRVDAPLATILLEFRYLVASGQNI